QRTGELLPVPCSLTVDRYNRIARFTEIAVSYRNRGEQNGRKKEAANGQHAGYKLLRDDASAPQPRASGLAIVGQLEHVDAAQALTGLEPRHALGHFNAQFRHIVSW